MSREEATEAARAREADAEKWATERRTLETASASRVQALEAQLDAHGAGREAAERGQADIRAELRKPPTSATRRGARRSARASAARAR